MKQTSKGLKLLFYFLIFLGAMPILFLLYAAVVRTVYDIWPSDGEEWLELVFSDKK